MKEPRNDGQFLDEIWGSNFETRTQEWIWIVEDDCFLCNKQPDICCSKIKEHAFAYGIEAGGNHAHKIGPG